jgi:hypothetical protein
LSPPASTLVERLRTAYEIKNVVKVVAELLEARRGFALVLITDLHLAPLTRPWNLTFKEPSNES